MFSKAGLQQFPLVRSLVTRQLFVAFLVLVLGSFALVSVYRNEISKERAKTRAQIEILVSRVQEELRAQSFLGLQEAFRAQVEALKKQDPAIRSVEVVLSGGGTSVSGAQSNSILLPEKPEPDLPSQIWVTYDVPSVGSVIRRDSSSILFGLIISLFSLLIWTQWRTASFVTDQLVRPIVGGLPAIFRAGKAQAEGRFTEIDFVLSEVRELYERHKEVEITRREMEKNEALARIHSQLAHDIRSPIAALQMIAHRENGMNEEARQILQLIATNLKEICQTTLDGYRSAVGAGAAMSTEVAPVLRQVVAEKELASLKNEAIEIRISAFPGWEQVSVCADPVGLRRVFSNVIQNALEASPARGQVEVRVSSSDGLRIEIEDQGQGIPDEVLPKLFKEGATFGKQGGNGLGLAHAKNCLEDWGGAIALESCPGKGTCVIVTLRSS